MTSVANQLSGTCMSAWWEFLLRRTFEEIIVYHNYLSIYYIFSNKVIPISIIKNCNLRKKLYSAILDTRL